MLDGQKGRRKMTEQTLPYARIGQIINFVEKFPKKNRCDIEELIEIFGKSNLYNFLPTLELLELINYNKKEKTVKLSNPGLKVRDDLSTNKPSQVSKVFKSIIENKEPFRMVIKLLDRKEVLRTDEIGKQLAFQYNKKWKNPVTFKAYGSSIAGIIAFSGFGYYSKGIISLKRKSLISNKQKPNFPSCSFNTIVKITTFISKIKEADLPTLKLELGNRVSNEIGVCVELGVIEKLAPNLYGITEKGFELVSSFNEIPRDQIWREILCESKYGNLIPKLQDKVINSSKLGEFLNRYLEGHWKTENTIKDYGKRFMTWLRGAKLLEKISNGEYRVLKFVDKSPPPADISTVQDEIFPEKDSIIQEQVKNTSKDGVDDLKVLTNRDFYNIGLLFGLIYDNNEKIEIVKKNLNKVISIFEKIDEVKDIIKLLEDHLELYEDIKDSRIFIPDLKLLEKKIGIECDE